ncbi:hypothetical protein Vadar_012692 [Vaccinium darrowii]|uniref:Uncharacterized protein n=1 Tax=Vaccinium darrowii TaxID=229202 RepID=A0ACB7YW15_9ERIC|nr:hypothetical protein Vadar_012692 [Vaccinium darrowii]
MVKTQMPGCSFQGLGLEQCLNQGKNSMSIEQSCCIALNQAVQASFHCLCMLLASSKPELTTPLLFPLSNCFISVPPLTQCQDIADTKITSMFMVESIALVPVLQPPVAPVLQPLVPPAMPDLFPPAIPQEPPVTLVPLSPGISQKPQQPSAPTDLVLPPPPQEVPLKSSSDNNSMTPAKQPSLNNNSAPDLSMFKSGYLFISKGQKKKNPFQSRLSLAAALCACMM